MLSGAMSSKIPGSGWGRGAGWLRGAALGRFGDTEEKVNPSPSSPKPTRQPAGSDGSGVCALVSGMSGADPVLDFRESLRCFPHFPVKRRKGLIFSVVRL